MSDVVPLLEKWDLRDLKDKLDEKVPYFFRDEEHDWDYPNIDKFQAVAYEKCYNLIVDALRKFQEEFEKDIYDCSFDYMDNQNKILKDSLIESKIIKLRFNDLFKEVFGDLPDSLFNKSDKKLNKENINLSKVKYDSQESSKCRKSGDN